MIKTLVLLSLVLGVALFSTACSKKAGQCISGSPEAAGGVRPLSNSDYIRDYNRKEIIGDMRKSIAYLREEVGGLKSLGEAEKENVLMELKFLENMCDSLEGNGG